MPGLLAFKSQSADGMSNEEYVDAIWPTVEVANSRAEGFSQITKDMIYVFASNIEYPRTDKGSIIRAQVYKVFAEQINEMYATLEDAQEGSLKLDLPAIESFLKDTYEQIMGAPLASIETDFFTAGVDSLKAIQMRRIIQKTLDLRGHQLSRNIVYERRNPKELARYLYSLGHGKGAKTNGVNGVNGVNGTNGTNGTNGINGESKLINQMITKYSDFGETAVRITA